MQLFLSYLQNWLMLAHLRLKKAVNHADLRASERCSDLLCATSDIAQTKQKCLPAQIYLQPISEPVFLLNLVHFNSLSEVYGTGVLSLL